MTECRKLTSDEFYRLMGEAPESETRNVKLRLGSGAYDFFEKNGKDHFGLIINDRPVYLAVLNQNNSLWTIVNSNVKEQFTLYKYCKKSLNKWLEKYGSLTATMEKVNPKNIKWTKFLGFKVIDENEKIIRLELRR